jgi:hypothetical protein
METEWDDFIDPWRGGVPHPNALRPPLFPNRELSAPLNFFHQSPYLQRNYRADPNPNFAVADELLKRYRDDLSDPKKKPFGPYPVGTLLPLRFNAKDVLAVMQWHTRSGKDPKVVFPKPVRACELLVPKTGRHPPEVLWNPLPIDAVFSVSGIWLNGFEIVRSPNNGPAFQGKPWRGVLHTTADRKSTPDGHPTVDGAIATYGQHHNDFPHLTIDPNIQRMVQHLPLDIGARALGSRRDDSPTLLTNGANAIQIEIVGFVEDSPKLTSGQLTFIFNVMYILEHIMPIPHSSGLKFLAPDAAAAAKAQNRMDLGKWEAFSGWCGHQHVPFNNHTDPGAIDIDSLIK